MNSKFLSIVLIVSLVAPLGIGFVTLHLQKIQIRKIVSETLLNGVEEGEIIELKFTVAQAKTLLKWEHSKEFEYKGQMFDVIEQKIIGDTITYKCWWDRRESAINQQLDELIAKALGNDPFHKDRELKLMDFLKKLFIVQVQDPLTITEPIRPVHFIYLERATGLSPKPSFPPPRPC